MKLLLKNIIAAILRTEARVALVRHRPKVVAVVGTVGKTSAKDAIFAALSRKYYVRKSEKSFNSELGVPLTVLGLSNAWMSPLGWVKNIIVGAWRAVWAGNYPEWLVLELGVDRPGDMEKLASWIHPDVAVLTRFGIIPVHVEFFPSPEHLIAEKMKILRGLKKDGMLVLNADDPKMLELQGAWEGSTITYGLSSGANVQLSDFGFIYNESNGPTRTPAGVGVRIRHESREIAARVYGTLGKSIASALGAAFAVGLAADVPMEAIGQAFEKFSPPRGRMRIIAGVKDTLIIDDTYNSSPLAAEHALETLSEIEGRGRKIAVLGDMLELGKYTREEHIKIGKLAGSICNIVASVGIRARDIAEGALQAGMSEENVYQFEDSREAGKFVQDILKEGDYILMKGSQSIRAERAVEEIMADPEKKEMLLVRQGPEWVKR